MAKIHLIAIGGAVMHQLAIFLSKQGNEITGSDDVIFDPAMTQLKQNGLLPPSFGWDADHIHDQIDLIILGMHAKADNVELLRAKELGLTIYSFPEFIYEKAKHKKRIVIAGSHGKTSITSMIMHVLQSKGIQFDYLVGSRIQGFETMVRVTDTADCIIIEGDEYLSSAIDRRSKFLHYRPDIAVISGIAWDHINVFPTFEQYLATFREFIKTIPAEGQLIYYEEDEHLGSLIKESDCNQISYTAFDTSEKDGCTLLHHDGHSYDIYIFGRHNMENLKAAVLVCQSMGVGIHESLDALTSFMGSANRLERVYSNEDQALDVYRDFAHAPSKLKASVNALRTKYPDHILIALFELHTYSSLQSNFLAHYANCLKEADVKAVFLDAHALEIKGRPNIADNEVIRAFDDDSIRVLRSADDLGSFIAQQPRSKAVYAFMSSGNFDGFDIASIKL